MSVTLEQNWDANFSNRIVRSSSNSHAICSQAIKKEENFIVEKTSKITKISIKCAGLSTIKYIYLH